LHLDKKEQRLRETKCKGRMMVLDGLICLAGAALIGAQAWSAKNHFDMAQMRTSAKVLSVVALAAVALLAWLVVAGEQPVAAQIAGLAAMLGSWFLFWATIKASHQARLIAAFDERMPHTLLQDGPYAFVRHPFYSSYILQWLGWALGAWSVWALVPLAGMTTVYWYAAADEEARFEKTAMAQDYAAYKRSTGRFLPRLGR
jgi:protein-S-isoprenylcysteine O-methyltransferase Ste14